MTSLHRLTAQLLSALESLYRCRETTVRTALVRLDRSVRVVLSNCIVLAYLQRKGKEYRWTAVGASSAPAQWQMTLGLAAQSVEPSPAQHSTTWTGGCGRADADGEGRLLREPVRLVQPAREDARRPIRTAQRLYSH